jgi:hypothetical protein
MPEVEGDVIMLEQLETSRMTSTSADVMAISPSMRLWRGHRTPAI